MILSKPESHAAVLVDDDKSTPGVVSKQFNGKLHRVVPQSGRDVFALQMLDHQREKFAPLHGPGIMVTDSALDKIISE